MSVMLNYVESFCVESRYRWCFLLLLLLFLNAWFDKSLVVDISMAVDAGMISGLKTCLVSFHVCTGKNAHAHAHTHNHTQITKAVEIDKKRWKRQLSTRLVTKKEEKD